jgi:hypothetical protein
MSRPLDRLSAQAAAIWADALTRTDEPATGHGERMEALISHAAETFDPETGTWRRPKPRWFA